MLVHIQCGGIVTMNACGHGVCSVCGQKVSIRVSNK